MMRSLTTVLLCLTPAMLPAQWSVFEPLSQPQPPRVADPDWSAPIDAFVYAQLTEAGLRPAPPVTRTVWIRRVTFDLTGLPPTPESVDAFLADARPDPKAMRTVVDRLLASPRYGERWARHWLDVVRYADSDGFAIDEERLSMWRFRDYVIRVFNEDRPFDQFIHEQLAGDELAHSDSGRVAISFYRLGPWEADNMTAENRRQDYLNDVTTTVGSAFLGLTIGCARCHDHKFDPITQADFYQLQAFISPIRRETIAAAYLPGEMTAAIRRRYDLAVGQRVHAKQQLDQLRSKLRAALAAARNVPIAKIDDAALDKAISQKDAPITAEDAKRHKQLKKDVENLKPEQRFEARAVAIRNPRDEEKVPETFVLNNGDVFDPGDKVAPAFLSSARSWMSDASSSTSANPRSAEGRRQRLAEWITSTNNPITPRVLVNRLWHHHFGSGLVATPNDFGNNGSGPSHPELLDYLARQLLTNSWRLKHLQRTLVLSRAYRSSGRHPNAAACQATDPDNRLLWHIAPKRLESEAIRDAILAVSGRLRHETGGPGFYEALPEEMETSYSFFTWTASPEDQRRRRSVYMFLRRNLVHPLMEDFDGADLNQSCELRQNSVTAPQALALLNGRFSQENSRHLARRVHAAAASDSERIDRLFRLTLSRAPQPAELQACAGFLKQQRAAYAAQETSQPTQATAQRPQSEMAAWSDLSLVLLNTTEFLYLD